MPLETGRHVGPYEILSAIGAGGMGEVYKARDARLGRSVAIKVLPAHLAEGDRRQRFEREAQAIASLNHPHICIVHDVGQHDGLDFLVMEHLEGETLGDRLAKGPLPFDQLLTYAIQIGDALDKAHRHGVIHRDLKPGNIMITKTGVKLLDFGLAKIQQPVSQSSHSIVPTLTSAQPLTAEGSILGTLQYMSPEQIEGRDADARADIFAFGAVLYEMATGRRPFEGKSQVSLIAAILEHDPPPVSALQKVTPPRFDDVIRICLAKNPDDRWQTAADLVHELKLLVRYASLPAATAKGVATRERAIWSGAVLLVAAFVAAAAVILKQPVDPAKTSFEVPANSPGNSAPFMLAVSPDGRHLVTRITDTGGTNRLWVRPLERVVGFSPPGTEAASYPFWSADGRNIGFFGVDKLKKVDIFGAPPQALADVSAPRGGTWSQDGVILYAPAEGPLFRINASGGTPVQVTQLDKARSELAHRFPQFLPDGDHFLYLSVSGKTNESAVFVGSLASKSVKRLVNSIAKAEFSSPDLLLFMRENTLMAQRFDPRRLELSGDPFQVIERVGSNPNSSATGFSVSPAGVIAYRPGAATVGRQLVWIDRRGTLGGVIATGSAFENPRLSPDGKRLALYRPDNGGDIWVMDLERGNSTRFTFDPASDNGPIWSPDGSRVAFSSNRDGGVFNLYVKSSTGTGDEELLLKTPNNKFIDDWSADGRYILYEELDPKTRADLWVLPTFGDRKPQRLLGTPFNEYEGSFSPDGRWIAYESNETGQTEAYVQSFPPSGGKWQVSTGTRSGNVPRWRADGKELFYDAAGVMMAVDLTGTVPGGSFKAATPQRLFDGLQNLRPHNYDVVPRGDKFLVLTDRDMSGLNSQGRM